MRHPDACQCMSCKYDHSPKLVTRDDMEKLIAFLERTNGTNEWSDLIRGLRQVFRG